LNRNIFPNILANQNALKYFRRYKIINETAVQQWTITTTNLKSTRRNFRRPFLLVKIRLYMLQRV